MLKPPYPAPQSRPLYPSALPCNPGRAQLWRDASPHRPAHQRRAAVPASRGLHRPGLRDVVCRAHRPAERGANDRYVQLVKAARQPRRAARGRHRSRLYPVRPGWHAGRGHAQHGDHAEGAGAVFGAFFKKRSAGRPSGASTSRRETIADAVTEAKAVSEVLGGSPAGAGRSANEVEKLRKRQKPFRKAPYTYEQYRAEYSEWRKTPILQAVPKRSLCRA